MAEKYTHHCLHCNQDFTSRSEFPGRCALCYSVTFDTPPRQKASDHVITPTRTGKPSYKYGKDVVHVTFGGRPLHSKRFGVL